MSRLPVPFRRKQTPLERAMDLGARALKFYAVTVVAKKGAKVPLIGVGLAGAAFAAKKLRGGAKAPEPQAYAPPPTPSIPTTPKPDPGIRESPHGDVAADLLEDDSREAASGGRDVGTPAAGTSAKAPSDAGDAAGPADSSTPARGTTKAPPAGVAGRAEADDQQAKDD